MFFLEPMLPHIGAALEHLSGSLCEPLTALQPSLFDGRSAHEQSLRGHFCASTGHAHAYPSSIFVVLNNIARSVRNTLIHHIILKTTAVTHIWESTCCVAFVCCHLWYNSLKTHRRSCSKRLSLRLVGALFTSQHGPVPISLEFL